MGESGSLRSLFFESLFIQIKVSNIIFLFEVKHKCSQGDTKIEYFIPYTLVFLFAAHRRFLMPAIGPINVCAQLTLLLVRTPSM